MVSDGKLHVGMSFHSFGYAKKHTDKMAKLTGKKIDTRTFVDKNGAMGNYYVSHNNTGVQYETGEYANGNTHYVASMGDRTYEGIIKEDLTNNRDKIMELKFTKIYSADGKQYAEDRNGNGIIDKGEIFDCIF